MQLFIGFGTASVQARSVRAELGCAGRAQRAHILLKAAFDRLDVWNKACTEPECVARAGGALFGRACANAGAAGERLKVSSATAITLFATGYFMVLTPIDRLIGG
jgi:hypothetical protein